MNGGSFANLHEYEQIPMQKFLLMLEIHNEAVKRMNSPK